MRGGSPLVPHVGGSGAGERAAHAAFRRAEAGLQGAEWLSRENALGEAAEAVFAPAAKMPGAEGRIKLENRFVDGAKLESAAGRRAFARKRAVEAGGERLDEKSRAYIRTAEDVWEDDGLERGEKGVEEPGGKGGLASRGAKYPASDPPASNEEPVFVAYLSDPSTGRVYVGDIFILRRYDPSINSLFGIK
ncbi:MAG: hypothetical protein LBD58_03170 [Treponema sp.]|jgi:hypothetical protein|nr:hypothetical protein [Treponema sp.]